MNDILKHCEDNIGGVYLFRIVLSSDVIGIAERFNGKVCEPVTLKAGARWYDFYGTEGTMDLKEDQQENDHGSYFKIKLVASVPKIRTSIDETFEDMKNKKFIVDCIDNNGHRKLLGTISEPLQFKYSAGTGVGAPNKNGYSVEFYGDVVKNSPTYYI